ncbi:GSCOCG00002832001-RA-CDS [Cotesia congregata]|nr:GSCOCG00002832001-RA-CDS [Cotesia congregata]
MNANAFQCPNVNCYRVFSNKQTCVRHIKNMCAKPEPYQCEPDFKKPRIFLAKISSLQSPDVNKMLSDREELFKCPNENCSKIFGTKKAYNYHIKFICNKDRRFKCFYCDYKSNYSRNVRSHSKSKHLNIEPKVVQMCDPQLYDSQLKPEPEIRKYSCPNINCDKKYRSISALKQHVNYECGAENRYQCRYCDFTHFYRWRLREHYLAKHPDKVVELDSTEDPLK